MDSGGSFERALRFLAGFVDLERSGMDRGALGLDRIRALLAALGSPDTQYRSFLIAGTKGKGSTAAMIERALRHAGYQTGLYTQPHLHTIRERIRVDGDLISPEAFGEAMDAVRHAVEVVCAACGPTTAYEVVTALALDHFARAGVNAAVLEVGLGGRLAATNAVAADVSVLTSISLDHMAILGDTVEAIAGEKADIIKPGRPCVSAPQPPGALDVIRAVAERRGSRLHVAGIDGAVWDGDDLVTESGRLGGVRPALVGRHQRINAAVAATALTSMSEVGVVVPLESIRVGIEQVEWPGRFEIVPGAPVVILDGAHNVESAERLRQTIDEQYPGSRPMFVVGIAADKDVDGILRALAPSAGLVATQSHQPRALAADELAARSRAAGHTTMVIPHVSDAIQRARAMANAGPVVVTGSLYVVAEAREALGLADPSGEDAFNPWGSR